MFYIRKVNQSGVVIIMALVILVIASVLAVTFATSMRLEEKTAAAFKKQGKVSGIAQAGYEYALAILRKDKDEEATRPYDALNEDWRVIFSPAGDEENPAQNLVDLDGIDSNGVLVGGVRYDARWIYLHADANPNLEIIGRFAILIVDESSKINLHASGSGAQNQGWTPFEIDLTNLSEFSEATAAKLINYRQGDKTGDGVNVRYPGNQAADDDNDNIPLENDGIDNDGDETIDEDDEGIDEPDEYIASLPYGSGDETDFALKMVDELTEINGIGKITMRKCKNLTTVDARDGEKYWDTSATTPCWQDKININAVGAVNDLFNLIAAETSDENAARWTTNIIDYGDRDNVPTVIQTTEPKKYLGIEGLQINEVMAKVHPAGGFKGPVLLDNWDDPGQNRWNDPDSFTNNGNWGTDWVADGVVDGCTDTWTWPWDNGTYDIYIYRDSDKTGLDFDYDFQNGQKTGRTEFGSNDYYLIEGVEVSNDKIELKLTARNIVAPVYSWFQELRFLEPGHDPDERFDGEIYTCKPFGGPFHDPVDYPLTTDPYWPTNLDAAKGIVNGGEGIWTWDVSDGTYDVYLYQNLYVGNITNPFNFISEEGGGNELTGTVDFGADGKNTWYHVGNVTISGGQLNLKLIANYTATGKSWFNGIGVVAGQYVELINLSPNSITIDKTWGINVGGNIVVENNVAKIPVGSGSTHKFTWFKDNEQTFEIPASSPPNYNYFIAADSRYALDYKHAYGADFKDGIWGSVGNEGNEPGYLGVIGVLDIPDAGGVNISLVREVNGEDIVVDFIPSESNASGFGTSYWHQDSSSPQEDKSFERAESIQDTSAWTLTIAGWGQGTPGGRNSGTAWPPVGPTKDRPFPSPGFIMDVYTGTDSSTKITHTDVRNFIQKLTTAYHRLEIENCDSLPGWPIDTGMDGTTRYLSDGTTSAALTWGTGDNPKLHIPDGNYNLFIAGGIGGKFKCPLATARAMRPDGLAYCGTATIGGGSLTVNVFGDGSNLYSLDYILLIPNKDSPPSIGKININTASVQVLNALPPAAFATGGHIIDHRNGADNKDGTTDDNPFESIGEYLYITGYGAGGDPLLVEAYQKQANLITVRSDIFEIIVLGQMIEELTNIGQYDPPPTYDPENPLSGAELMSDEITGQEKIRAIVDRSFDPPKVLYFRRELK